MEYLLLVHNFVMITNVFKFIVSRTNILRGTVKVMQQKIINEDKIFKRKNKNKSLGSKFSMSILIQINSLFLKLNFIFKFSMNIST